MKASYSKSLITFNLLIILCVSQAFAGGGTWSEINDAPSFPDKSAQISQGAGKLLQIIGQTSASDVRDSYCIKITDTNNFSVTSDANTDPAATATFDTRLFLFDKNGKPLLFNDDTAHNSAPFHSTLTGAATDGSGYVLDQPGEYVLVVTGFAHSPIDSGNNSLFNFNSGNSGLINGSNPISGRFAGWDNATPATGDYFLGLQGVEFCQENLDIIGTNTSESDTSMCFGDGQGDFPACNNESSASNKDDLTIGYFNKDKHLDVIFDEGGESPTLCLGSGLDGFNQCNSLDIGVFDTSRVAVADINNDQKPDAVFIGFNSTVVKICLGNGVSGFLSNCTEIPVSQDFFSNIDLAYMDTDNNIDLIVHGFNSIQICPGDGVGSFGTCNNVSVQSGRGLEINDINNDNHLDIVTYAEQQPSQVCLNDGTGAINCSAMNALIHDTTGIAMNDLNADGNIDAVFSNNNGFQSGLNKVCLGDGLGAFTCTNVSGTADNHKSVSLGDLNGDGFLDAVFGVNFHTRICYGVGDGTFTDCFNDDKIQVNQVQLGEFGEFTKWTEINDAPSFPDGQAQVTRGKGELPFIFGTTSSPNDHRDAYCIKIDDPSNFQITSDSITDPFASATFDTRLFLFDKLGTPVLFNDDTPPSASPFASTLTGVATDNSGYVLSQAGEYVLVVAGFSNDPLDGVANPLFAQTASLVHAPDPSVGHFNTWENSSPATGNYSLTLQGVSHCQDKIDLVATAINSDVADQSYLCAGDGQGNFGQCDTTSISSVKSSVSVGYLDQDSHLDAIFDDFISDIPSICLGDGLGAYRNCSVFVIGTNNTNNTALADVNNDGFTDVAFSAAFDNHRICLGNGLGQFTTCSEIPNSNTTGDVKFAYMNADNTLDVVFMHFENGINICYGAGDGTFSSCTATNTNAYNGEIADINSDGNNDIVTSSDGATNNICINNGSGTLTCNPINANENRTNGLALGDLDNNGSIDIVFSNVNGSNPGVNQVCLNDGNLNFSCSDVSGVSGDYSDVKLALLNDDNISDVVFVGFLNFVRTCIGNGNGSFSHCNNNTNIKANKIQLGEFGDFDVIFANGFE